MFGVSHGAIQFMTYEEMKKGYNKYKGQPLDSKFVSFRNFNLFISVCSKYLPILWNYAVTKDAYYC